MTLYCTPAERRAYAALNPEAIELIAFAGIAHIGLLCFLRDDEAAYRDSEDEYGDSRPRSWREDFHADG